MTPRHLILVGLPGAGKTTVGSLVAEALDLPFVDIDALIEERIGSSPAEIFADRGEAAFRELEREAVVEVMLRERCHIVAPGGGWAAQPGALNTVTERAVTVYLETTPEVAATRTEGSAIRPLLDGDAAGREARMRELFEDRRRSYSKCDVAVATDDRTAADVARRVTELARNAVRL